MLSFRVYASCAILDGQRIVVIEEKPIVALLTMFVLKFYKESLMTIMWIFGR
jgi:hypothetical protein